MCFSVPKPPEVQPTPRRDESASLATEARMRALSAQGARANIFTSALGDSGFGGSVNPSALKGAALLGQSSGG